MILATDGITAMMNVNLATTAYRKMLTVYGGTPLTKADIEAALYSSVSGTGIMNGTTRGQYNQALINSLAIAKGGVLRGFINYPTTVVPQILGANKFRLPFAESNTEMTKVAVGECTWFTMTILASTATGPTSSALVAMLGIGSIGDIGSGADLELLNSAIDNSVAVRANDLTFTWSGL